MQAVKLNNLQEDVLVFFGKNSFGKNFYWTGGTLLAYRYLPYRNSVDLDFFSENLFAGEEYLIFLGQLKKSIGCGKINLTVQQNRRICLAKRGKETVKLEFVYFPFPRMEKREKLPEFSLKIDSLTDIMVNKTLAAYQRNEPKDALDLFYYLSQKPKYNIFQLAGLVEKKFGVAIEPIILLSKLNKLTDNLDLIAPLLIVQQKNLGKRVKSFFQNIFNIQAGKKIKL